MVMVVTFLILNQSLFNSTPSERWSSSAGTVMDGNEFKYQRTSTGVKASHWERGENERVHPCVMFPSLPLRAIKYPQPLQWGQMLIVVFPRSLWRQMPDVSGCYCVMHSVKGVWVWNASTPTCTKWGSVFRPSWWPVRAVQLGWQQRMFCLDCCWGFTNSG